MGSKRVGSKSKVSKRRQRRVAARPAKSSFASEELRRALNEAAEARAQQSATAEILRIIASWPTDVQPVFDAIVTSARRLIDGFTAVVTRVVGAELHLGAFISLGKAEDEELRAYYPRRIADSPMLAEVVGTGMARYMSDVQTDPRALPKTRELAQRRGYKSILVTPMVRKGVVIGLIHVTRAKTGAFSEHQIELLKTFADQAVIAIENVRLFNETREALERQTATADILRVISSSPTDVNPVFEAILDNACRLCDSQLAAAFRYDGTLLHLAATKNWPAEALARVASRWPSAPDPKTTGGRVVLAKGVVLQEDTLADATYDQSAAHAGGWRRMLGVPMLRDGEVTGVIVVTWREPGKIPARQVDLLKTFADQAVIAVENVRLFNETREALERQTATAEILKVIAGSPSDVQPVFDAIAGSAFRLLSSAFAAVLRRTGDGFSVAAKHSSDQPVLARPNPESVPIDPAANFPSRVFLGKQMLHIPDWLAVELPVHERSVYERSGVRSSLMLPLLREGECIGVLVVARATASAFSEKEIALMQAFVDQAVIAIENVRLFNETKEALERQTATAEILKVISSSPTDVQPVFDIIGKLAEKLCAADSSLVSTFDGELMQLVALHGYSDEGMESLRSHFPMRPHQNPSVTARVFRGRVVVHLADVLADPLYGKETARSAGLRAVLGVPMLREGQVVGVICVGRVTPGPYDDAQIDLLKTFADQAVIAIENVRLFKELQAQTEALTRSVGQLTALGEVGQAISSTLDLETVLKTIVNRAMQLTGLDAGVIYEYEAAANRFELRASENFRDVGGLRGAGLRVGEGAVGGSVATREPKQVPDTHAPDYPARLRDLLDREGFRAILAVPLLREDQTIGALMMLRKAPGPFAPEIVDLLKTFASQSALAIQNARLFREIAEKGRQLEEASRHKSQFLASMSHELRTPLNAILGFNEMLLDQAYGEVPVDMKEPLADIQSSGKHLLRLINNVLDLAKIEAGRMELALADYSVHDTVERVRSTLRPLAAEKGLEFVATLPEDLPLAYGDFGRITQCLMNLAGNSLKFTKAGKVEISVELPGDMLVYRVSDTGIGIPPDKLDSLFAEFKQTDATIASEYGGTGLGLSITKKFIEMHGGRIWVESELGKGSAFIFEVPLRAKGAA